MKKQPQKKQSEFNRRDFLKGSSLATFMMMMGGVAIQTPKAKADVLAKPVGPTVKCALIGCGSWGREILATLARFPNAQVVAVCDTYAPFLRRAGRSAPEAEQVSDYQQLLGNHDVQAVFVATPSHTHREIAVDALKAGKHVYCEAPLATNLEDARAIAREASKHPRVHFQVGQQLRSDPQFYHLASFIRAGALGRTIRARSQWNQKQSWRRAAPTAEREREMNWHLRKESSTGLIGEVGVHQLDLAAWYLRTRPVAVTGHGATVFWNDGRTVPDTVHALFEFPGGVFYGFDSTLGNSFDAAHDVYYGSDSAIMIRDRRAWMFKEVDSPLLGWEVYARKESFYKERGIVLGAGTTQLTAQGDNPVEDALGEDENPLYFALEAFLSNSGVIGAGVEDFVSLFGGDDDSALMDYLEGLKGDMLPYATYQDGYEAAVLAIKGNEAVLKSQRLPMSEEWFQFA
jgi:predicted dehydrogenase